MKDIVKIPKNRNEIFKYDTEENAAAYKYNCLPDTFRYKLRYLPDKHGTVRIEEDPTIKFEIDWDTGILTIPIRNGYEKLTIKYDVAKRKNGTYDFK